MNESNSPADSGFRRFGNAVRVFFRRNSSRFFFILLFLITLLRIFLGADRLIQEYYLPHDDLLYLRLAHHIANGEWLGPFDPLTLAKSCIFPLFIAAAIISGLPYLVLLDLLICGAMFLTVQALRPSINRFWSLVLYAVLVFNPAYFFYQRLVIQDIYAALITGMIGCLMACWIRRDWNSKRTIPWIIGSALFFAFAAHAREEAKVLVFVYLGVFLLLLLDCWLKQVSGKQILRTILVWIAIPAVCYGGLNLTIKTINWHYYGIAETSIRYNRSYRGFIGSLLGAAKCLDPVWDIRIPLRYEILDQLYEMSPTLKQLKPFMNRKNGWHMAATNRFPPEVLAACPNLAVNTKGGFIQWEIMESMQNAGLFREGNIRLAAQFCQNVIRELETAAGQGKIPGFKVRYSNLVPFSSQMKTWFLAKFAMDAKHLFTWGVKFIDFQLFQTPNQHPGTLRFYYASLKNNNLDTRPLNELMGWGRIPAEKMILRSQNFPGPNVLNFISMPRPDVRNVLVNQDGYQHVPLNAGFILLIEGQQLTVRSNDGKTIYDGAVKLGQNGPGVYIDHITSMKPLRSILWKRGCLKKICLFYRNYGIYFSIGALVLGFIGLLNALVDRRVARMVSPLIFSGLIFWGTGFMYFCLIVFANTMLHCSRQPGYYMPAFAQIFTACMIVSCGMLSVFCTDSPDTDGK